MSTQHQGSDHAALVPYDALLSTIVTRAPTAVGVAVILNSYRQFYSSLHSRAVEVAQLARQLGRNDAVGANQPVGKPAKEKST